MNSPEQADFSAERTKQPNVLDQLLSERNSVDSTRGYVFALGTRYNAMPEHKANMLQLQRMAGLLTNPTNEPSFPQRLTDAFYWGEILAYTSQERIDGKGWADASYMMLNRSMTATFQERRDSKLSGMDNLLDIATKKMLELAKAEHMSPAMDQFVAMLAIDISDNKDEQTHIVLGFRHIIMQITQIAQQAEHIAAATKVAYMSIAQVEADTVKANSVESERVWAAHELREPFDEDSGDVIDGTETESINDIPGRIMESYRKHMHDFGPFDDTDEDVLETVQHDVTERMGRDFRDMEGIKQQDFIRVSGNAVFLVYSESDEVPLMFMLGHDEHLEGFVETVALTEIPTENAVARLLEHKIDITELDDDTDPIGAVLVLKDPVLIRKDGTRVPSSRGQVAGIVLHNTDMYLQKYLL